MSTPELLTQVVRATAGAGDVDTVLDRVAQLLLARADWVIADRLDDPDLVSRVATYDRQGLIPPPRSSGRQRRSSAASVGLIPAVEQAPHRILRLDRAALERLAGSSDERVAAQVALALGMGVQDLLVVGVAARDVLVAVLSLGSATGFDDDDVRELADVALHVGTALDAARLLTVQREVATAMQTSLLPPLPSVPGLRLAARYVPAAQGIDVGGDWYDAFVAPAGVVVVVGDASGHDVAAAARMADLRNLLRGHAVDRQDAPADLVTRLERTAQVLGLDATATCVVGILTQQASGWHLVWTSAGHLPPVHVHAGQAALLETPADLMLGVDPQTERHDHVRLLAPGDLVLLYSDGLVERRDATLGQRLELLRATVQEYAGEPPDELAEVLLRRLAEGSTDDMALLVLQVDGPPGPRDACEVDGVGVEEVLDAARDGVRRLTPLQALAASRRGALLVDTRTETQRAEQGELPGALVIDRTVLEWRLDPAGADRIPEAGDPDVEVVVACRQGYSSSLAAASLRAVGLRNVTDMEGGVEAWLAAGLPVTDGPADVRR